MASPQCLFRHATQFTAMIGIRALSSSLYSPEAKHFKLAVIGGGAGGSAISSMFSSLLGKQNVVVIEPNDIHYYQPLWTLVGGGLKKFEESARPMSKVLKSSTWIKDKVTEFLPTKNSLVLGSGDTIKYDYLVIAMGIRLRYDLIKGLEEAVNDHPEVCTNYDPRYVQKTIKALENFEKGTLLFTMNMPIKCPGAPQKIMYLADDFFRKKGKRDNAKFIYATASNSMMGAKYYGDILYGICQKRGMKVNFYHKLAEIDAKSRLATFELLNKDFASTGEKKIIKYDFIHVGPPCSPPKVLTKCKELTDTKGFMNVDKYTLQSNTFPNVFGIGDCTNLPNAKTAAAVAAEAGVVRRNLRAVMENKKPTASYNGYSSCPVPTTSRTCVLAEFDYNWQPLETFPIDQGKERRLFYFLKADFIPRIYWHGLVKGRWEGPALFRKLLRFGFAK